MEKQRELEKEKELELKMNPPAENKSKKGKFSQYDSCNNQGKS